MWEPVFPMAWVYTYLRKYARRNVAQRKIGWIMQFAYLSNYARQKTEKQIWYNTYKSKQKDGASDGRQNERGK